MGTTISQLCHFMLCQLPSRNSPKGTWRSSCLPRKWLISTKLPRWEMLKNILLCCCLPVSLLTPSCALILTFCPGFFEKLIICVNHFLSAAEQLLLVNHFGNWHIFYKARTRSYKIFSAHISAMLEFDWTKMFTWHLSANKNSVQNSALRKSMLKIFL